MNDSEDNLYSIRITSHGKIKNWVTYALKSFQENPDIALTFHTIPPKTSQNKTKNPGEASKFGSSLALVPRLITVVEIVKREYLHILATTRSPRLKGLHQYNELGVLEEVAQGAAAAAADAQHERAVGIIEALSGNKHVRQTQMAYMRVTLSLSELPSLQATGATYQPPTSRKLSKSAKARARKREKKKAENASEDSNEPPAIVTGDPMVL